MLPTEYLEIKLFWSHDRLPEQCPPKHLYALFPTFPAGYVCLHMKCLGDAFLIDMTLAELTKSWRLERHTVAIDTTEYIN